jgi:peptidoglycan/LPS O-acetylase OafA/YrhL
MRYSEPHLPVSAVSARPPAAPRAYLPALTGLRAVAAWLVFFHHYPWGPAPSVGPGQGLHHFVREWHGLPLLLLLSGFLLALRYDPGRPQFRPRGGWWPYLRNRVARIYPLFGLLTLAAFALLWRWHSPTATPFMLLLHLSLLRGFFDEFKFTGIGPAWSLTLLECFYLAAPLLMGLRARGLPLWVQPLLLAGLGASLVALLAPLQYHGLFGSYQFMLEYTFLGHSLEFFLGMGLAGLFGRGRLGSRAGWWRTGGGVVLWLATTAALALTQAQAPTSPIHSALVLGLSLVGLPLAGALLFAGLLSEDSGLRRLLSSRLFQHLGRSSYAFYLLHAYPLSYWVYERLPDFWPLRLLVVQALAYAAYRLVEKPLHGWLRARR